MTDTSEITMSDVSEITTTDNPVSSEVVEVAGVVDVPESSLAEQNALSQLFDTVRDYGLKVRSNGTLNGKEMWDRVKPLFKVVTDDCNWNIYRTKANGDALLSLDEIYDYVHDELGMKGGDEDQDTVEQDKWEKYHFYLQLIRVPRNNPDCSLVRLMQVAYNLGQLQAEYDDSIYTDDVRKFLDKNDMDALRSYVDPSKCRFATADELADKMEKIKEIGDDISDISSNQGMSGGSRATLYYQIYLKNRRDYQSLKHNV